MTKKYKFLHLLYFSIMDLPLLQ